MQINYEMILNSVLNNLVWLALGALGAYAKSVSKKAKAKDQAWKNEHDKLMKGLSFLLRAQLERYHATYVGEYHCIKSDELEEVKDVYDTYHALGGNGVGTKIYDEIKTLPIKD